jgi:hypothetical protein
MSQGKEIKWHHVRLLCPPTALLDVYVLPGAGGASASGGSAGPSMIDNRALIQVFGWDESLFQLKENLYRGQDFVCVTPRCWTALAAWYGSNSPLARHVISVVKQDAASLASPGAPASAPGRKVPWGVHYVVHG